MSARTRTRPLARIAWRDMRRNRGRSLLVVALIAVPVAACVAGLALFHTTDATPEQRATHVLGRADLLVGAMTPDTAASDLGRWLPAGSEVEPLAHGTGAVAVPGGEIDVQVMALDVDGLAAGMLEVRSGRAATDPAEVTLSTVLAEQLGLAPGATVLLDGEALTVVGTHRNPELLSEVSVARPSVVPLPGAFSQWLVELPPGTSAATVADTLNEITSSEGEPAYGVTPRSVAAMRSTGQTLTLTVLGGLALVEAALVAAAAFAVSTRRRQRELGLVAAVGGSDLDLRRAVLFSGLGLGLVGSLAGLALGVGGIAALTPWLSAWADRVLDGVRVPLASVVAIVVGGVAAAMAAAWVPARTAARVPILLALSGRRPPPGSSGRGLVAGMVLAAVGVGAVLVAMPVGMAGFPGVEVVVPLLIIGGSLLCVLGFGMMSPWLVEQLGRLAPRLPVGPRLALRDTARFRSRNGPVVTAVLAGLALSVALAAGLATLDADDARRYVPELRPDQLRVAGAQAEEVAPAMARDLDAVAVAEAPRVVVAGDHAEAGAPPVRAPEAAVDVSAGMGEADLVRALGGDDAAVAALDAGRAVAFGSQFADLDRLETVGGGTLDVHVVDQPRTVSDLPDVVLSPAVVEGLPLDVELVDAPAWAVRLSGPVGANDLEQARSVAASALDTTVTREEGFRSTTTVLHRVVLGLATLTGLVVLAIALALSAAETRADQRTLLAVGADPRVRRSLAAGRALVLAGLGGLLAVPAGLLPAWGLVRFEGGLALAIPWSTIGIVAVVLPAVAVVGAWLLTPTAARWTAYRPVPR